MMQTNPKKSTQDQDLIDASEYLIKRAKELGADAADCACDKSQSLSTSVRMGALENVEREESRSAGLRVLFGKRQAGASSSALNKSALDELAERVVQMAKLAAEDPYCGIIDSESTAKNIQDLALEDTTEPEIEWLEQVSLEAEAAALKIDGIKNIAGCGASWGRTEAIYAASNGFIGGYCGTYWSISIAPMAQRGEFMERDYDSTQARFKADLKGAKSIGISAANRAVSRLGATKMPSIKAPVILEARVARSILGMLIGAISGNAIARGVSFLRDDLGKEIFTSNINIIDDPFIKGGWGSKPFDGEGAIVSRQSIIENGMLNSWLLNSATAKQLGLKSNGHASMNAGGPPGIGVSNFILQPSNKSLLDLIKLANNGLLVSEAMSPSFNPNTGDYSVGVSGRIINNGELGAPVSEITIAGNMKEIFKNITQANDLENKSAIDCPSLLIDGMIIGGS